MGIKTLQTGVPEFSLNIIAGAPSGGKNSGSKNSRSSSTNTPSATSFGIDFGIGLDTPQREGKLKLFYISLGTCRSMRRCAPSSTRCRR